MIALFAPPALLLAQDQPAAPMSYFQWVMTSLGFFGVAIPLLGFAILAGAFVVVTVNRRPAAMAAYLLFVPAPLFVALFALAKGTVASFSIVALSDIELKQSELAGGLAESGLLLVAGLLATVPSYLVVAIGLFIRTLQADETAAGRR
jgi:hypothetical protein